MIILTNMVSSRYFVANLLSGEFVLLFIYVTVEINNSLGAICVMRLLDTIRIIGLALKGCENEI
jgi:hypothetical protein